MKDGLQYHETRLYRCQEYLHRQSDTLYLMMCGLESCIPGKSYGPARRAGYHLHVVLGGEGTIVTEGKEQRVHSGQLFLEKPGETTYYRADQKNPWTYCWVTFDGEKAAYYMEQAGFPKGTNVCRCGVDNNEFLSLITQLLSKTELNLANDLRRLGLLSQFIGLAVESNVQTSTNWRNTEYNAVSYVDHALEYMRLHFRTTRVSEIADSIGINRCYLSSIF